MNSGNWLTLTYMNSESSSLLFGSQKMSAVFALSVCSPFLVCLLPVGFLSVTPLPELLPVQTEKSLRRLTRVSHSQTLAAPHLSCPDT